MFSLAVSAPQEMESQLRSGRSPKSRGRRELHGAAEGAEALRSELGEAWGGLRWV